MIDSHVLKEDPDHPVFHMDLDTRGMPYQTAQDLAVFPVNSEADNTGVNNSFNLFCIFNVPSEFNFEKAIRAALTLKELSPVFSIMNV